MKHKSKHHAKAAHHMEKAMQHHEKAKHYMEKAGSEGVEKKMMKKAHKKK